MKITCDFVKKSHVGLSRKSHVAFLCKMSWFLEMFLAVVDRGFLQPLYHTAVDCESFILSNHSRFNVTCECNKEEIDDDE